MKKFISIIVIILIICGMYTYARSTKELDLLDSLPKFPTTQMLEEITEYNNVIDYKEEYVKERGITTNFVIDYSPKDVHRLLPIKNIFVLSKFNIVSIDKKDRVINTINEASEIVDHWIVNTINYEVECILYIGEDQSTATIMMQTYTDKLYIFGITDFDASTLNENWKETISPIIEKFFNSIY